jgi:hypothetical protein
MKKSCRIAGFELILQGYSLLGQNRVTECTKEHSMFRHRGKRGFFTGVCLYIGAMNSVELMEEFDRSVELMSRNGGREANNLRNVKR